jgi:hypothetical protein
MERRLDKVPFTLWFPARPNIFTILLVLFIVTFLKKKTIKRFINEIIGKMSKMGLIIVVGKKRKVIDKRTKSIIWVEMLVK